MRLVRVAVPVPGLGLLTYRLPDGLQAPRGTRVVVQVGPRKLTGLVTHDNAPLDDTPARLRDILEVLDDVTFLPEEVVDLALVGGRLLPRRTWRGDVGGDAAQGLAAQRHDPGPGRGRRGCRATGPA